MRPSNQIFLLLAGILIGIMSGGYLVLQQLATLRDDAFAINNLGVIRGSIQLISKRELNDRPSITQIDKVDGIFLEIENRYLNNEANLAYIEQFNIHDQILALQVKWNELKHLYRAQGNQENAHLLIMDHSEKCWELADKLVYEVQKISELKLNKYQNWITLVLSIIFLVILAIITVVYVMIRSRLEREVITDPLTDLHNRHYFNDVLRSQVRLLHRYNEPFTLILLDIDFFKKINDEFGHPQGDQVLVQIAKIMKENTRDVDFLFRIGGEEFAVISPHSGLDDAMGLAEKYRNLIVSADFKIDQNITVSIGVSQSFEGCQEEDLYKNADKALYQAKASGRNKTVRFVHDVNEPSTSLG